ncbi:MAG TPA: cupin domain-containing protein [Roseiarcus sp.]|nr:cupin domain-containing protein [Roseiarcus sp.]
MRIADQSKEQRSMMANDRPIVTRKGQENDNTAQSGGLALVTGVGPQHTPAMRLWFGKASNAPGFRSLPHHHGEAETGAYLLSGRARIYFGKDYREFFEMYAGDFMFVPPFLPHLEANMSTTEELWWLACRSPENIVVNLPDIPDSMLAGYRRV